MTTTLLCLVSVYLPVSIFSFFLSFLFWTIASLSVALTLKRKLLHSHCKLLIAEMKKKKKKLKLQHFRVWKYISKKFISQYEKTNTHHNTIFHTKHSVHFYLDVFLVTQFSFHHCRHQNKLNHHHVTTVPQSVGDYLSQTRTTLTFKDLYSKDRNVNTKYHLW